MIPGVVAALDADVLVPIVASDFLLTAFDLGIFEPVVSIEVLAEVERTLIEDFPHLDPVAIRHRVESMRVVLEDQTIDTSSVKGVPDAINAKDRHVVAAALEGEASVIVTNDSALRSEIDASDLELDSADLTGACLSHDSSAGSSGRLRSVRGRPQGVRLSGHGGGALPAGTSSPQR